MGTRSMIIKEDHIERNGKLCYRLTGARVHWDGYLEGVGASLSDNVKNYDQLSKTRIFDPETGYISSLDDKGCVESSHGAGDKNLFEMVFEDLCNPDEYYKRNALNRFFDKHVRPTDLEYVYFAEKTEKGINWLYSRDRYMPGEFMHDTEWTALKPIEVGLGQMKQIKELTLQIIKEQKLKLGFGEDRLNELFKEGLIFNYELKNLFCPLPICEDIRKVFDDDEKFLRFLYNDKPDRYFENKEMFKASLTRQLEDIESKRATHEEIVAEYAKRAKQIEEPEEEMEL